MSRFRTVAAGAILLFGTTFLWFMPSFLGTSAVVEGAIWSIIQLLALATVIGYAGAAWALYRATTWWRSLAIGGSILGTLVLGLWWLAVNSAERRDQHGGQSGPARSWDRRAAAGAARSLARTRR
jgi:type VI protein secretion system component VasK